MREDYAAACSESSGESSNLNEPFNTRLLTGESAGLNRRRCAFLQRLPTNVEIHPAGSILPNTRNV